MTAGADVPPPGAGVTTVICAVPGDATSAAEISATSRDFPIPASPPIRTVDAAVPIHGRSLDERRAMHRKGEPGTSRVRALRRQQRDGRDPVDHLERERVRRTSTRGRSGHRDREGSCGLQVACAERGVERRGVDEGRGARRGIEAYRGVLHESGAGHAQDVLTLSSGGLRLAERGQGRSGPADLEPHHAGGASSGRRIEDAQVDRAARRDFRVSEGDAELRRGDVRHAAVRKESDDDARLRDEARSVDRHGVAGRACR